MRMFRNFCYPQTKKNNENRSGFSALVKPEYEMFNIKKRNKRE
jgi:hypothetical protein